MSPTDMPATLPADAQDAAETDADDSVRTPTARRTLDVCLTAMGSYGDVLPFVALGRELRARGHAVTILANEYHADHIRGAQLDFAQVGTAREYLEYVHNPDIFHPVRGIRLMSTLLQQIIAGIYDFLVERNVPGRTVTAGSHTAFSSRIARETLGIPMATICLQPAWFFSADDPPVVHTSLAWLKRAPRWCRRGMNWFTDRMLDRSIGRIVHDFRANLGLSPWTSFTDWSHSPDAVVGLFPEWFAPRQVDWPANFRHAEFPLFDGADASLSDEVESFLAAGDPPVVFTPGSGQSQTGPFIEAAVDACRRLSRRGIILSKFARTANDLPADIRQFEFVPLGPLMRRAAALVHHGGIGTMSQALRAGIPQVVTPLAYDQPDNAVRLSGLGLAKSVNMQGITGRRLARALDHVLSSPEVAAACRRTAEWIPRKPTLSVACEMIEGLVR
jgi:UDP:flavonoid glycosyltransferase YjiC (YdhE family)